MRSSPANASLTCVPIDAIWTSGIGHQSDEERVHDEVAERHRAGENRATADDDHHHADDAGDHGRSRADRRRSGDRLGDVAEELVRAAREHQSLARLGHVDLHQTHAADRLGEPAGDFGVDRAAFAEERTEARERLHHHRAEREQDEQRGARQLPVQIEQNDDRDQRRHDAAEELNQPRADEIAHALGVAHDARDQNAGLRRVEVRDRQTQHVRLHALSHFGDRALRGDAHDLRERERGGRLNDRGAGGGRGERHEQVRPVLSDDVVDQELRRRTAERIRRGG